MTEIHTRPQFYILFGTPIVPLSWHKTRQILPRFCTKPRFRVQIFYEGPYERGGFCRAFVAKLVLFRHTPAHHTLHHGTKFHFFHTSSISRTNFGSQRLPKLHIRKNNFSLRKGGAFAELLSWHTTEGARRDGIGGFLGFWGFLGILEVLKMHAASETWVALESCKRGSCMTERTERLERLGLRGLQIGVLGQNSRAYVA